MPEYAKKSAPLFFSTADELLFETELRRKLPAICFVDGSLWETAKPNAKDSIAECRSNIIFLWDRSACSQLPYLMLNDGRARGPTSGVVVQYIRSYYKDGILTSGDIGIGFDKNDAGIASFVKVVWQVARSMNTGKLVSIGKETGKIIEKGISEYLVGPEARKLSNQGMLLKHCAVEVYYRAE